MYNTREFFDQNYLSDWLRYRKDSAWYFLNMEVGVCKRFLPKKGFVLDLMCGPGILSERIKPGGSTWVGLDFSKIMLSYSKSKKDHPLLVMGNAKTLPFMEGAYDAVFCLGNELPFFPDETQRMAVLAEAFRVLKPGGGFVLSYFNRFGIHKKSIGAVLRFLSYALNIKKKVPLDKMTKKGNVHHFTFDEIKGILQGIGFKQIKIETRSFSFISVVSCRK